MSIRVVARIIALPNKIKELKTVLIQLVEPTRKEKGCLQYELLQNQEDTEDFTFVEEWENREALQAHLDSQHIKLAIQKIDKLVALPPDIRVYNRII
jgi:quinol monooxygenase YgiN